MDDFNIEQFHDEGREGIAVSGDLTIMNAPRLKEALLASIGASGDVVVDIAGVTAIDLTGLQLLCAAHQSAGDAGKAFQVAHGGNSVFHEAADAAGFLRHVGCGRDISSSCIWVGGEK